MQTEAAENLFISTLDLIKLGKIYLDIFGVEFQGELNGSVTEAMSKDVTVTAVEFRKN